MFFLIHHYLTVPAMGKT